MRLKGLDLNLLIALDILLEERSVSRAAKRLHLSQPAASAALGRLRDYFQNRRNRFSLFNSVGVW